MTDYRSLEKRLRLNLGLQRRPVAVAFRDAAPSGVLKFAGSEPSGCSFWRLAMNGRAFYTTPADHIGYIKMEEVPGIPRLPRTPGVVVYAPLGETPVDPDVVLFAGRPGRVMLLQEAALRAGVAAGVPLLARPTCMALPAALAAGAVASTACIGNRVYTDVGEDELYVVVPGKDLARVADEVRPISDANNQLSEYHRERRRALATE